MYVNVENVNFAYDKKPILHDINFGMNKGEITGLIGPNGAGKSTMLKLMIKKMKPNNGKIIIGDNDIFSIKRENNPVTFIPDIPVYYEELTVCISVYNSVSCYNYSNKRKYKNYCYDESIRLFTERMLQGNFRRIQTAVLYWFYNRNSISVWIASAYGGYCI